MKIRIIYNSWLVPSGYAAMMIYPFILVSGDKIDERTLKHELQHVRQIKRVTVPIFYITYVMHFIKGLVKYRNWSEAYFNIPYEKQAFNDERSPITKEEFSWLA